MGSSTIRNDQPVARQRMALQLDLIDCKPSCSRQLMIGFSPSFFVSGIDKQDLFFSTGDLVVCFGGGNSGWLHAFPI